MFTFSTESDLREFIKENVITAAEVSEILGCSRQYTNKLVKTKKLIPVKQTDSITLFLKSDVEKRKK